jgi:hypothetical protein
MITLLDPPENDEVMYNVLYATPPNPLRPQQSMGPTTELSIDINSLAQNHHLQHHQHHHSHWSEEVSTDDETTEHEDDNYNMSENGDDDTQNTVDSLRKELSAIEDSWGKHGLEHLIHLEEYERVDGIPTFTMPVNLDMSWDESDFLEEMAEDMKILDAVAGKVLHEEEVGKHLDVPRLRLIHSRGAQLQIRKEFFLTTRACLFMQQQMTTTE